MFLLPKRRDSKGNIFSSAPRRYAMDNYAVCDISNGDINISNNGDGLFDNSIDNPAYVMES